MKKISAFIGSILICYSQFSSAQDNPLLGYLPESTKMVAGFNPVKLASKVPGETFRQSFIYREMMKDPSAPGLQYFNDLTKTGIDFSNDLLVIVSEGKTPGKQSTYLLGLLQDAGKFESMIRSALPKSEIRTYGTDRVSVQNDKNVIAWNNRVFIFGGIQGSMYDPDGEDFPIDDTSTAAYEKWMEKLLEKRRTELRDLSFEWLTPRSGNSLATDARFKSLFAEPGDVHIWNQNQNLGKQGFSMQQVFGKLATFFAGKSASVVKFENGKISWKNLIYPNPEMAEMLTRHPPAPAGDDLLKNLPKGNLLGLFSTTYNNNLAQEIFKQAPFNEFLDSLKNHSSFDITKLPTVFGNRAMLAVMQKEDTTAVPGIDLILAVPISDPVEFKKMGKELLHLYDSLNKTDSNSKILKNFKPVVRHNDNLMVFSLSEKTALDYLNQAIIQPAPEWTKEYVKYPMFIHVNLRQVMKMALSKNGSKEMGENEQFVIDYFDQILIYGGGFENGATQSTAEFRFKNQNENAIKQLFELINIFGGRDSEKKERPENEPF